MSGKEEFPSNLVPIKDVNEEEVQKAGRFAVKQYNEEHGHHFIYKGVVNGLYAPIIDGNPKYFIIVIEAVNDDGNVQPYQFPLPPTWKQARVANILSGNYCQLKCAEPWVEVKFEEDKQGKIQVVASPLIRLTNKPNATIEDIGSPDKVIASLGPFVTGNTFHPEELVESSVEKLGDHTYYKYTLETPYALTGTHNLTKATAKGSTVVLFVARFENHA
ncbi:psbP domain-containing protein 6, chloroplastic-like [Cucurbita moschata]|uniref:PsbP domain-containing protein 6, chloroplastic-like n=1 Tax=Cucurbita moschata TaxID=3662 RepID=A0A6J1HIL1_CUCMO|nr:psbP domain-containing protein 6, chloroplastic-like [Cucurbita moschata]